MISTVAETSEELRSAYKLAADNLTGKGLVHAKEAPLHLEITLDARDASLALGSGSGPQSLSAVKAPQATAKLQGHGVSARGDFDTGRRWQRNLPRAGRRISLQHATG